MKLPFSVEQFFSVFEAYNQAIWPAQIVAYMLGLLTVFFVFKNTKWSGRFISGVLALSWVWMGFFYHIIHFATINPAAKLFGPLFIVQGLLFAGVGCILDRLDYNWSIELGSTIGAVFILYSMLLYPLLGYAFGYHYPSTPMFGVAPCPSTIFTFGVLMYASSKVPWYFLPIPFLWSLVGMSAAISLQVPQDYGLVVAGIIGTVVILRQNRNYKK